MRRVPTRGIRERGRFPTNSLTEDFELSIHLHERGWKSAYVPDVLSRGVGPEDTAAYISQQQRWARGCLSGVPRALRARLPIGLKIQYVLSGVYWLSGWTLLVYMSFPVVRLLGGGQPIGHINAPVFLLHFVPYYAVALTMAAVGGAGTYKFSAYALSAANFWIQILATFYVVLRKSGSFVVTPKKGAAVRQPRAVMPTLATVGVLVAACIYGLAKNRDAATINNVSFAAVHVSILMTGCWAALQKPSAPAAESFEPAEAAPRETGSLAPCTLRRPSRSRSLPEVVFDYVTDPSNLCRLADGAYLRRSSSPTVHRGSARGSGTPQAADEPGVRADHGVHRVRPSPPPPCARRRGAVPGRRDVVVRAGWGNAGRFVATGTTGVTKLLGPSSPRRARSLPATTATSAASSRAAERVLRRASLARTSAGRAPPPAPRTRQHGDAEQRQLGVEVRCQIGAGLRRNRPSVRIAGPPPHASTAARTRTA